jgi:hypothetical protein
LVKNIPLDWSDCFHPSYHSFYAHDHVIVETDFFGGSQKDKQGSHSLFYGSCVEGHVLAFINDHSDDVPAFADYHLGVIGRIFIFLILLLKNSTDY